MEMLELAAELKWCRERITALEAERDRRDAEITRLRAELADKTKRLDRIATLLRENEPGNVYYGLDDDVGDHGCCGLLSYKPHAPDCWFAECRALAGEGENNDGNA